jgi:endonuclease YncB( thermonuclease family)
MISRMATVLLLLVLSVGAVLSAPITSNDVRVIDGDTIRLHHQKPDVRLVGFNAPETRRAICAI